MYAMLMVVWSFGYGAGFEGLEDGKVHFGFYTPRAEYGYVLSEKAVYLDTVFEKNNEKSLDKQK